MWFKRFASVFNKMELARSSSRVKFASRQLSMDIEKEDTLLTIAVCQMTARSDKEENFNICKKLISTAKTKGAKMVFLPEGCDFIGESKELSKQLAESLDGETMQRYKNLAKELQIWISLGGVHEKGPTDGSTRISNSHVIVNDRGDIASVYRKVHLFDVTLQTGQKLHESEYVVPGSTIEVPVETPMGRIGLGICYDVRFPEFSVALTRMGAEILTYPSAFTVPTGMAHWEVLLRSRAIENQCYVVAAAQTGTHNDKRQSYGHAMVVDPWGAIAAQCHEGTDVALADVDLSFLHKIRRDMPIMFHRRKELYETNAENVTEMDKFHFGQILLKNEQIFYKTLLSMAFVNRKPVLPGHILVSPIRVAKRISDLSRAEIADLFTCVQKVQSLIENIYDTRSSTIVVQDGADAGQTIQHIHVHVLPRKAGDFEINDDIYKELQTHDETDKNVKSDLEMAEEAKRLRENLI